LKRPGRRHHIEPALELPFEIERQNVSVLKVQIAGLAMFLPGNCQIRIVAIKTHRHTVPTDYCCDIGRDGPSAATDIENGHPSAKEARQSPMVPLQCAAIEDSRIGPVRLLAHFLLTSFTPKPAPASSVIVYWIIV
jgi:hypothetical protein